MNFRPLSFGIEPSPDARRCGARDRSHSEASAHIERHTVSSRAPALRRGTRIPDIRLAAPRCSLCRPASAFRMLLLADLRRRAGSRQATGPRSSPSVQVNPVAHSLERGRCGRDNLVDPTLIGRSTFKGDTSCSGQTRQERCRCLHANLRPRRRNLQLRLPSTPKPEAFPLNHSILSWFGFWFWEPSGCFPSSTGRVRLVPNGIFRVEQGSHFAVPWQVPPFFRRSYALPRALCNALPWRWSSPRTGSLQAAPRGAFWDAIVPMPLATIQAFAIATAANNSNGGCNSTNAVDALTEGPTKGLCNEYGKAASPPYLAIHPYGGRRFCLSLSCRTVTGPNMFPPRLKRVTRGPGGAVCPSGVSINAQMPSINPSANQSGNSHWTVVVNRTQSRRLRNALNPGRGSSFLAQCTYWVNAGSAARGNSTRNKSHHGNSCNRKQIGDCIQWIDAVER